MTATAAWPFGTDADRYDPLTQLCRCYVAGKPVEQGRN